MRLYYIMCQFDYQNEFDELIHHYSHIFQTYATKSENALKRIKKEQLLNNYPSEVTILLEKQTTIENVRVFSKNGSVLQTGVDYVNCYCQN